METEVSQHAFDDVSSAELTPLGVRLEILRIQRGLSKQGLARTAGTSRQQLWRVMTGKSELTPSLRQRLATALECDTGVIVAALENASIANGAPPRAASFFDYLGTSGHLTTTLSTLPACEGGRQLKRAFLQALETLAVDAGHALPSDFVDIHRRVHAGEL